MAPFISVIIPNYNSEKTIGLCLEGILASTHTNYEVIVVDDCSSDSSVSIIKKYPCRLIRLAEHGGASKARNTGAASSTGDVLFFIDADCIMQPETLNRASAAYLENGAEVIIGGTYSWLPYDMNFFSVFQSVYIHYCETKNYQNPDYIASHPMLISMELFQKSGGFDELLLPILEDVELSHRIKRMGYPLYLDPHIQVQHIFNFTMIKSMRNAARKSKYWSIYSIKNKDLLSDSGTASRELKFNVLSCFLTTWLILMGFLLKSWHLFAITLLLIGINFYINRHLFSVFFKVRDPLFAILSVSYYALIYPFAVGLGAIDGIFSHFFGLRS